MQGLTAIGTQLYPAGIDLSGNAVSLVISSLNLLGGVNLMSSYPHAWPDATNTGVQPGVVLTPHSGNFTTSSAGQVVFGLDISGAVEIQHPNVTVVNCRITNTGNYGVDNTTTPQTGLAVLHCTIIGPFTGIIGTGNFQYNDISQMENGIVVTNNGAVIQHNYMHGFLYTGTPHYDGIEINGNLSNIIVQYNTIDNQQGQTSCININNSNGPVDNILVDTNKLNGGSYTVYVDGHFNASLITNVRVSNNLIGIGTFGYIDFNTATPTYYGNTDITTGAYLANQSPEIVPGTPAFSPSVALNADDNNINISLRVVCTLGASISSTFKIVVQSNSTVPLTCTHIGVAKSNGTTWETISTMWEATFDGASGVALPAGQYIESDPISIGAVALNPSDQIVVILDVPNTAGQGGQRISTSNTNVTSYFATGVQSWNQPAPAGFSTSANNNFSVKAIVVP